MERIPNAVEPDEVLDESEVDSEKATPEQMAEVLELSREQLRLKKWLAKAEAEVSEIERLLKANTNDLLPKAMQAAHIDGKFSLGGGAEVALDEKIRASIPSPDNRKNPTAAEDNARGIAYMDSVAPSLVKNQIYIEFEKGDEKFFEKFMRDLRKRKRPVDFTMKRTVHPSTLSSWVKERLLRAEEVDDTAITVQREWVAEVKLPKKKKDEV